MPCSRCVAVGVVAWFAVGAVLAPDALAARLVIHPAPPNEPAFADYSVTVNGRPVFVAAAQVNRSSATHGIQPETVGFASFDFAGEAQVAVTAGPEVSSVRVGPQSLAITPVVEGRTITFTIAQPCQLCLELNGSDQRPLFLFANALESYPGGLPQFGQEKIRYFGPGVHDAGEIRPQSGETIYLAGGALVYGKIAAEDVRGVRILGRGMLDGSKWKQWETSLIKFTRCADVEIRGIILRDSPAWTVVPHHCDRVTVADVKILNYRKNSDGINLVNCRDVTVDGCFVRNYDDSIVVKAVDVDERNVEKILVRNCVIWCDWGFSLGATYETRVAEIRGLRFENCDVLHGMACRGVLGLKIGDRAKVHDVRFENIRVEDARIQLFELVVDQDMFSKDEQRGQIAGVVLRNVALLGGEFVHSTLAGFDEQHCVEDVTIENLRIHGKLIMSTVDGNIHTNHHVKNLLFLPGS